MQGDALLAPPRIRLSRIHLGAARLSERWVIPVIIMLG
jgi:hypothetical protein